MEKTVFTGSACALITPFDEDGRVDIKALKRLTDFQITNGTDAIVVCGTTGEGAVLTNTERRRIVRAAVRAAAGRVPVIAGTGSNNTELAVAASVNAEKDGADALLVVTPYYNKCSADGLADHYRRISDAVNIPIIVYNVPSRTGLDVKPEDYARLCEIENVVAIKEANGSISSLLKTMSLCRDRLDVYSGHDDQTAAFTSLGAKGVISVLANILPRETHELAAAGVAGRTRECADLQLRYADICSALFADVNPVPVKYAMKRLGLDRGIYRLPLTEPREEIKERIDRALNSEIVTSI